MASFHGLGPKKKEKRRRSRRRRSNFSPLPLLVYVPAPLSPSLCPFTHPLFCFSTSIQPSFSSPRLSSFWSKRRGSSVLRLVLPKAPGVCSNTGAEGLLLGALRCALIASHSTGAVWERVAMATQSFALLYLRVLFAVRSQE